MTARASAGPGQGGARSAEIDGLERAVGHQRCVIGRSSSAGLGQRAARAARRAAGALVGAAHAARAEAGGDPAGDVGDVLRVGCGHAVGGGERARRSGGTGTTNG